MAISKVALIQGDDRRQNITQALDLVGEGIDWASRRCVLIKPNFVSTERPLSATHVEAVRALLDWLRCRYAGPIVIGEGAATRNTWEGFANYGYLGLPDEYPGVELRDLNADEPATVRIFDRRRRPLTVQVARTALQSDCRIAIGPPKTHDAVIVTLGLKNMIMGSLISRWALCLPEPLLEIARSAEACVDAVARPQKRLALTGRGLYANLPGWVKNLSLLEWMKAAYLSRSNGSDKQRMHQGLPWLNLNLFALAPLLRPHLSVIDGWVGMEGDGPTRGDAVAWRVAVASTDFLAADALTAELMGFPIEGVGYLHYCHQAGLGAGRLEEMDIVGNVEPEAVRRAFRPSPTYRLQKRWQLPDSERWLRQALRLNPLLEDTYA
ncbi:MAG: DUF362 domain-containing protein [Anaerolineae bacterium]|nr:DUF362 domain-containing protein [Anaerolineae bacterium]